jgi:hypothetical protein
MTYTRKSPTSGQAGRASGLSRLTADTTKYSANAILDAFRKALIHWEIPRLCRGDVHSLTYPEVRPETLKREPPSTCKGESEWTSLKA